MSLGPPPLTGCLTAHVLHTSIHAHMRQVSATQRPGMGKDPLTHDKDSDAPIAAHALRQTAPLCARCPESVRDSAQVVNITLTSMALPRCRYDSDRTEPPSCCGTDLASLRSLPHCLPHTAVLSAIALHLHAASTDLVLGVWSSYSPRPLMTPCQACAPHAPSLYTSPRLAPIPTRYPWPTPSPSQVSSVAQLDAETAENLTTTVPAVHGVIDAAKNMDDMTSIAEAATV
jgi:hypothetical protein